jgi:hypothetical protein
VNAMGLYLNPIRSLLEVTNCDLQFLNSSPLNSNMKSSGNLLLFLRTACFRTFVAAP